MLMIRRQYQRSIHCGQCRESAYDGSIINNKDEYQYLGINSRLDPIQAATLSVNLKYLDSWNEARKSVAKKYSNGLTELGIKPFSTTPESVFHHYVAISENRIKTASLLKDQGVLTEIHYPKSAENNFQMIKGADTKRNSPKADELAGKTISLPMSPWITDLEINYVLDQISLDSIRLSFLGEM